MNEFNLKNKTSIVTGGNGYLGSAICEGLAEAGSFVYITGKNKSKCNKVVQILKNKGLNNVDSLKIDISDNDSIDKGISNICKNHNSIDILVNNAVYSSDGDFLKKTDKKWMDGIDGTINGVFRTCKKIIPLMKKNNGGSIINIASMYGMVSPDPSIYNNSNQINPPEYGAGKAAIIQFTKYLAVNYAKFGIRVNAISPGPFPNENTQKNHSFIKKLKNKVPMNRIGNKNEINGTVIFLASNASSYLTGQNISVDGGWTSW